MQYEMKAFGYFKKKIRIQMQKIYDEASAVRFIWLLLLYMVIRVIKMSCK
jgi:hypothetical protein